jgi:hypothetical protein
VFAYPNPSNQFLNVAIESAVDGQVILQVTDIAGRLVSEQKVNTGKGLQNIAIDLAGNEAGNYLIVLTDQKNIRYNLPVIYTGQ